MHALIRVEVPEDTQRETKQRIREGVQQVVLDTLGVKRNQR